MPPEDSKKLSLFLSCDIREENEERRRRGGRKKEEVMK